MQFLVDARAALQHHPAITVHAVSSLYHTAPVGFTDQGWFLNAVVCVYTTLSPVALLGVTQAIERRLGRTPTFLWGPRVLDIDILLYDTVHMRTPTLTIPHMALHERLFVLVPLHEIAPDLQIPGGKSLRDLLTALPNHHLVQKIGPFPCAKEAATP
jgi:2-amino-4-hydroxy-6-hydroxymethyldihydropteridine diphosphokinase